MPTKRQVLDLLTSSELTELVRRYDIIVGGRARAHLADRLEEKGPALPELVAGLRRARLKELCCALGLSEGGPDKSALLARLGTTPSSRPPTGAGVPLRAPLERGRHALSITHPELARQWHPDMNGERSPSDVSSTSRTVVWWICAAARPHVWQAAVSARASSDSGCPSCARPNKKLLKDHYPDLARQFHPTKNKPLVLEELGIGTERRIWWRCPKDPSHVWDALLSCRIRQPSCPLCTGRILTPENSLAGRFPAVAKEWHPTRNGALRPVEVKPSSIQRAWWLCARNPAHEWSAIVWSRTRAHTRCPVCFGSALSPEVAFATTHPEIAREWHPTRNGDLRPDQMRAGSERRVWWRCSRDPTHEWRSIINNRVRGDTCPMCSGRVATPTTSIRALYPEVARRWHPTRNGKLTPDKVKLYAKRKFWWRCPKDPRHEWQAHASSMGKCPICVGKKVIFSSSLAGDAPKIASEWHPTRNGERKPQDFYRYSTVRVWWRCPRDPTHEWENTIAARVKHGTGCPYCGGRAAGPNTSLAALYPDIAREWHPEKNAPLTPDEVVPGAAASVWWRCRLGHEWQTRICQRTVKGGGCRLCFLAKHRVWLAENNRARAARRRETSPST
jgi:hypothetical protein